MGNQNQNDPKWNKDTQNPKQGQGQEAKPKATPDSEQGATPQKNRPVEEQGRMGQQGGQQTGRSPGKDGMIDPQQRDPAKMPNR